ncbi:MAG: N-6 DNA methylase [Oceanicaulis sp.]
MLRPDRLEAIVTELARKPGHEKVRTHLHTLLVDGLGAPSENVELEKAVPEARGRIDALLGRTVFEIKKDLDRESADAIKQLDRYIEEREAATAARYVGIATDGSTFRVYERRSGSIILLRETYANPDRPLELVAWLDGAVAIRADIPADALNIQNELGRQSVAFRRASAELATIWTDLESDPAVSLKRQLWRDLLQLVYGKEIEDDALWFQHTFLVIVAKSIAARALQLDIDDPEALLSGEAFAASGVYGAVEGDFFDWIIVSEAGRRLVSQIAAHVARFNLEAVDTDVLKILYESLVDPEQRKDLGEYYTPDWLASRVVDEAVSDPLNARVIDPACGSGAFLFHAVRKHLACAAAEDTPSGDRAAITCGLISGIDVHPVAVIIARVTFLLALGSSLRERTDAVSIPVYLGDALQMQVKNMFIGRELVIEVPPPKGAKGKVATGRRALVFPEELCAQPQLLDGALSLMRQMSEAGRDAKAFREALQRETEDDGTPLSADAVAMAAETYETFDDLRRKGRDSIWSYVARNLGRPLYFSAETRRADVLLGNPPWIALRYMAKPLQDRFRDMAKAENVYAGGKLATQADISSLFFARCVSLYLRPGGRVAFVLPRAALTRGQYEGLRAGRFLTANVRFDTPWDLDGVSPLFPVPAAVLFAERLEKGRAKKIPDHAHQFAGRLPYRDAPANIADARLSITENATITTASFEGGSPYRAGFRQGATLTPRMLCTVERAAVGRLGGAASRPHVVSRRSSLEKKPWKEQPSIDAAVERAFLRPVYLGESIAPYRPLAPLEGVIPFDPDAGVLDSNGAANRGWPGLADWMQKAERIWNNLCEGDLTLKERWDYHGGVNNQFPIAPLRVVYAKAGQQPAAALIEDADAVIDHKLYWSAVETRPEGLFLIAFFNSEAARARVEAMQSRGQWGARDFDKVMFNLPIPRFDAEDPAHRQLADTAAEAEQIARVVEFPDGVKFQRARSLVRAVLKEAGLSDRIDAQVSAILDRDGTA